MVRVPAGWRLHPMAGSQPASGGVSRRIPVTGSAAYVNPVTVDLGNDGVAPQVQFTAAGTATARCGPRAGGESWSLDQCYLSTSAGLLDPAQCAVYAGPGTVAQYAVTGSLAGGGSQFGLGGLMVPFGWFVWALWTGGTAGTVAYLRVTGTKTALTA